MKGSVGYIAEGKIFHGEIPHVMGTRLEMLVVGLNEEAVLPLWDRIYDKVFELDRMLNRFDPESEVSQLNLHDNPSEHEMSAELSLIVSLAEGYRNRTHGLFDVTWQDGKLDFGGFGKGFFLKICDGMLRDAGVDCAFVNFGNSSILALGHHPYGDCWKVGVVDPYTHIPIKDVELVDNAMSTSGNSPSCSGHIRNPHTGEVCADRRLVSVTSPDPLDAEVLSTVLMIADADQSHAIREEFPDVRFLQFFDCFN